MFTSDGFEGPSFNALIVGDATVVSAVGDMPALSGLNSLFVRHGSVTFHLTRPTEATKLMFSVQAFADSSTEFDAAPLSAGSVGGSEHLSSTTPLGVAMLTTGDAVWRYATPKQDVTIPLTEPGSDLVVRINIPTPAVGCPPQCPIARAWLFDDLQTQ